MERQTGGSVICDGCGKLIGVDEPKCPFCGRLSPGLWGWGPTIRSWLGDMTDVPRAIIMVCVTLYALSLLIDYRAAFNMSGGIFSILSPSGKALYILGMTGGVTWKMGWWWTIFSANLLHGNLLHIVFNMYWVRYLAPGVQDAYGSSRLITLFVGSGAIGFLLSNLLSGSPTIGASGAVFGLLAALIVHARRAGLDTMMRQLTRTALILFVLSFVIGVGISRGGGGVNNWAHAGGFFGGWLIATLQGAGLKRESTKEQLLALGAILVSFLAIIATAVLLLVALAREA